VRDLQRGKHCCRGGEALMIVYALYGVAAVVLAVIAVALGASSHGFIYGGSLAVTLILCAIALVSMIGTPSSCRSSCGGWRAFPHRRARGLLSCDRQFRRRRRKPVSD